MRKRRKRKTAQTAGIVCRTELVVRLPMLLPLTDTDRTMLAEMPDQRMASAPAEYAERAHLVHACTACAALESNITMAGPKMAVCVSQRGWYFMHLRARWPKTLGGLFVAAYDANGRMLPPASDEPAFLMGITNDAPLGHADETAIPWDRLPVWNMVEMVSFTASLIKFLLDYTKQPVGIVGTGRWLAALQELDVDCPIIGEVNNL